MATLDPSAKPAAHDNTSDFRLWLPESTVALNGVLVLVPGFKRNGIGQVDDRQWPQVATIGILPSSDAF